MMTPAGALMIEHRLIERMIGLMQEQLERIRSEQNCDPKFMGAAVQFVDGYASKCHHAKEEGFLFRELDAKPLEPSLRELLGELRDEHVRLHALTSHLRQANDRYDRGEDGARAAIQQTLQELITLVSQHIEKEDKRFFVPAQKCFTEPELAEMMSQFREFDGQLFHAQYREVVDLWEAAPRPAQPANNQ